MWCEYMCVLRVYAGYWAGQVSATSPAVQQCISLINSVALSIHSNSPTKKHKSLSLSEETLLDR